MTPREEYILLTITAFVVIVIGALWLSFLASCSHARPRAPSPGVPLSVWTLSFTADCDAPWLAPAVLCVPGVAPQYGADCHWTCTGDQ